jgi:Toastrack DUF4097/LiaF transmembrane domain
MSSPTMVRRHRRSFAGPVVLIILGIVFLLGTMGVLHWSGLGHLFARFWPVLLIIWGLIKLIEHQQAQREGIRAPGIGAGGIFLMIVLVVFGLMATQASRVNWGAIRDEINIDDGDFTFWGNTYNYNDELSQAFPTNGSVHIIDDHGAVNVNVSDDNQIKVVVRKKIGADDQQTADRYNAQTKPQITVSGAVVTVNANTSGAGEHTVATDMDVSIPRNAAVQISSRRGDVSVNSRHANVDVSNGHGDVTVQDIEGNASLNLDHSSARAERIAGDVSIKGRANEVTVRDVNGAAHLTGEFMESVKLAKIAKGVDFKSSRTDMEFAKLDGELDLDSGDLHAGNLAGPLRLTTRSKDIRLEDVSGDVRLQDENGTVEVAMRSLGNVQITNRKGDILMTVPPKASFQIDARTRDGEVESDFGEIKVDSAREQKTASGTVGSGGSRVILSNDRGSIEVRKGSAVAVAPSTPPTPPSPKSPKALKAPKSETTEPTEN